MVEVSEMGKSAKKMSLVGFYGPEPKHEGQMSDRLYSDALTWYNYCAESKELIKYLITFLKKEGKLDLAKIVDSAGDTYFSPTLGKAARMMSLGNKLPVAAYERFKAGLVEGLTNYNKHKEDLKNARQVKRVGLLNENSVRILCVIEEAVERLNKKFDLKKLLEKEGVPAIFGQKVADHYQAELLATKKMMNSSYDGKEPLTEKEVTYATLSIKYMHKIIDDALIFAGAAKIAITEDGTTQVEKIKKPRKVRAKKVIPASRKVSKVKIRTEYLPLKIKSIDPATIVGKQKLWFIDIKYGKLTLLQAKDDTGLDVKGSTVLNYDETKSQTKRAGRKIQQVVDSLMNGGKVAQRHLMESITSGNTTVSGRLSENIVLLKTEK